MALAHDSHSPHLEYTAINSYSHDFLKILLPFKSLFFFGLFTDLAIGLVRLHAIVPTHQFFKTPIVQKTSCCTESFCPTALCPIVLPAVVSSVTAGLVLNRWRFCRQ